jgi:hypothetical protein
MDGCSNRFHTPQCLHASAHGLLVGCCRLLSVVVGCMVNGCRQSTRYTHRAPVAISHQCQCLSMRVASCCCCSRQGNACHRRGRLCSLSLSLSPAVSLSRNASAASGGRGASIDGGRAAAWRSGGVPQGGAGGNGIDQWSTRPQRASPPDANDTRRGWGILRWMSLRPAQGTTMPFTRRRSRAHGRRTRRGEGSDREREGVRSDGGSARVEGDSERKGDARDGEGDEREEVGDMLSMTKVFCMPHARRTLLVLLLYRG